MGNKAAAKELGAKGREHSEQMKKAHAAASENIFQQRNSRLQSAAVFNKNGESPVQAEVHQVPAPLTRLRMSLPPCIGLSALLPLLPSVLGHTAVAPSLHLPH